MECVAKFVRAVCGIGVLLPTLLVATAQGDRQHDAVDNDLAAFLANLRTLSVEVVQTEVRIGEREEVVSQGTLQVAAPGRFAWRMGEPYAQRMVADGAFVWVYDGELNQVNRYAQSALLSGTPAILLSNPDAFLTHFAIDAVRPMADGTWYDLVSNHEDRLYDSLAVLMQQGVLTALWVEDRLRGVRTEIALYYDENSINGAVDEAAFIFTVPEGADVIEDF